MSVYEAFAKADVLAPLEHTRPLQIRRANLRYPLVGFDLAVALVITVLSVLWLDPTPSLFTVSALAWPLICAAAGAYTTVTLRRGNAWADIRPIVLAVVVILAVLGAASYATDELLEHDSVGAVLPLLMVGSILVRVGLAARRETATGRRIIVIGDEPSVREAAARLGSKTSSDTVVAAVVETISSEDPLLEHGAPLLPGLDRVNTVVDLVHADTVVIAGNSVPARTAQEIAWKLEQRHVDVALLPSLPDTSAARLQAEVHNGLPLLWVRQPVRTGLPTAVKHGLDRMFAITLLVIIAPIFLALAAAVRWSSRGPAIFTQTRVGKDGQPFTLYKFRTMVVDAEDQREILLASNEAEGPLFKLREDPRVTSVGRYLRKFSLDELPQLFNVIKGEMSLVGPRPPLPVEVAAYDDTVRRRLLVRPGLTGLWQVSGRSDLSWEEAVRLDLTYVDNVSLAYDAAILRRTVSAVLKGDGAY